TVDHQVLVRVFDAIAYAKEQFQALPHIEPTLVAICIYGLAWNKLHHEVRPTIGSRAPVENLRDIGVIEMRQNLALLAKPADEEIRVHPPLENLDGHQPAKFVIVANGLIDDAHAAFADALNDTVNP